MANRRGSWVGKEMFSWLSRRVIFSRALLHQQFSLSCLSDLSSLRIKKIVMFVCLSWHWVSIAALCFAPSKIMLEKKRTGEHEKLGEHKKIGSWNDKRNIILVQFDFKGECEREWQTLMSNLIFNVIDAFLCFCCSYVPSICVRNSDFDFAIRVLFPRCFVKLIGTFLRLPLVNLTFI